MKIRLSSLVKLLDKNYNELARKLTREQVLVLDRLTTNIEYEGRGDEYYYPNSNIADELDAIGISFHAIEMMAKKHRVEMEAQHLTDAIEEQIDILEQLLIPTSRTNPIRFSEGLRNQIRKKLSKMSPARMEASLYDVKRGKKSLRKWLTERDFIAERDAEYAAALAKAGRGKEK